MSESTCKALCFSGKDCLRSVRTYLPGTCVVGVQTVSAMPEPTCGALCCRGAGCLSSLRTYLPELCYSGAGWLSGVGTYLPEIRKYFVVLSPNYFLIMFSLKYVSS